MAKRVKEKRHLPHPKRKRRKLFLLGLLKFCIGVVLAGMVIVGLSLTLFQIKTISVEGNTIVSDEEIQADVITGEYQTNGIYEWFINFVQPKTDIPFTESYHISFKSPSHLVINIDEVDILGFIALSDGTYAYFDSDGKVVEVSDRLVAGYLPVNGITSDEATVGKALPIQTRCMNVMLQVTKGLTKYDIPADAVYFTDEREIAVQSGTILLDFGTFTYLDEKIMRLQYILPNLEGKTGTLHLETWTPENKDIIFEENVDQPEETPAEGEVAEGEVATEGEAAEGEATTEGEAMTETAGEAVEQTTEDTSAEVETTTESTTDTTTE